LVDENEDVGPHNVLVGREKWGNIITRETKKGEETMVWISKEEEVLLQRK